MSKFIKGAFLTTLGGLFWGIGAIVAEYLFRFQNISDAWLIFFRTLIPAFVLTPVAIKKYGNKIFSPLKSKKDAFTLFFYGIPGVIFSLITYNITINLSNAAIASITQDLSPIYILMIICIIQKRRPSVKEIFCIIIALTGITLLMTHGNLSSLAIPVPAAVAGLISGLCVADYNILGSILGKKYPILLLQDWSFIMGTVFTFIIFRPFNHNPEILTPIIIIGTIFVSIFGTLGGFQIYLLGVQYIGPDTCYYRWWCDRK